VLAAAAHPSVAAMARTLLAGAPVVYTGDPLRDLSLTAFLDKFVQRKPKARARSAAAPAPTSGSRSVLREAGRACAARRAWHLPGLRVPQCAAAAACLALRSAAAFDERGRPAHTACSHPWVYGCCGRAHKQAGPSQLWYACDARACARRRPRARR